MDDDETTTPDDLAEKSAFAGDKPPHTGADDDPSRPPDEDLDPGTDLAGGGAAGA